MRKSTITATFDSDIQKVWDVVTDYRNYAWRSDLSKISIPLNGPSNGPYFIERDKKGFPTLFTVTLEIPCERYEFDISNDNLSGHWVGLFSQSGSKTQVIFTEKIKVRNPIMNLFVGSYLKKQQATYIADLRKALGE